MPRKCVAIIGAGGQGTVVSEMLRDAGTFVCSVWLWSEPSGFSRLETNEGTRRDNQDHFDHHSWSVAIGDNAARAEVVSALKVSFVEPRFPKVVADTAIVSKSATLGEGAIVHHGVNIGPQVVIGDFSIVNTLSNVEHHAKLGSYTHLAPGSILLGGASAGDHCFLGAHAVVAPNTRIPSNSIVGALSFVARNFELQGTFVGIPARRS